MRGVQEAGLILFVAGGALFMAIAALRPEGMKYSLVLGSAGASALFALVAVVLSSIGFAYAVGPLRDGGLIPVLYARQTDGGVAVGSLLRVLGRRMVRLEAGRPVRVVLGGEVPMSEGNPARPGLDPCGWTRGPIMIVSLAMHLRCGVASDQVKQVPRVGFEPETPTRSGVNGVSLAPRIGT